MPMPAAPISPASKPSVTAGRRRIKEDARVSALFSLSSIMSGTDEPGSPVKKSLDRGGAGFVVVRVLVDLHAEVLVERLHQFRQYFAR